MAVLNDSKHDVQHWIEQSLEEKQLENINVEISTGVNGDGYAGDIIFAKVSAESKNENRKEYHLVLKVGKKNEYLRSTMPISEIYAQEIYMYQVVFPFLENFQMKKGLGEFNFVPKCYKTFNECGSEVLVFENLKHLGYKLHNKYTTMNIDHMTTVLEAYGRWHALSFALKDQNKEDFERLSSPLLNVMNEFMKHDDTKASITTSVKRLRDSLMEHNQHELLRKFDRVVKDDPVELYVNISNKKQDKTIISHGDCWNNNFMFKYDTNSTSPSKVALLDWQMSYNRSPVYDLSYFIYSVSSEEEFSQLDKLLDIYYGSLANNIRRLGSDPETLFTRQELTHHWKEYSLFGFITGIMVMPFVLCELEDAPSLTDVTAANNFATIMNNLEIKNQTEYYRRVKDIVVYYTTFRNIV